jgi:hypothetical protein
MVLFNPSSASVTVQVIRLEIDTVITLSANVTQITTGEDVTLVGDLRRSPTAPVEPGAVLPGLVVHLLRDGVEIDSQLTTAAGFTFIDTPVNPGSIVYTVEFRGIEVPGLTLNSSSASIRLGLAEGILPLLALGIAAYAVLKK